MDLFNESKKRLNYFKLFSFEMLATIKKSNSHMNLLCFFMLKTFGALHFNNYAKCFSLFRIVIMLQSDDDISLLMSFFNIYVSFNNFLKSVLPINDHFYFTVLNKFFKEI